MLSCFSLSFHFYRGHIAWHFFFRFCWPVAPRSPSVIQWKSIDISLLFSYFTDTFIPPAKTRQACLRSMPCRRRAITPRYYYAWVFAEDRCFDILLSCHYICFTVHHLHLGAVILIWAPTSHTRLSAGFSPIFRLIFRHIEFQGIYASPAPMHAWYWCRELVSAAVKSIIISSQPADKVTA